MADPRFSRTAEALERAVLDIATRTPIHEVQVTELAQAAGVTRRTLYNHTQSPAELLVRVMKRDLDGISARFEARLAEGADIASAWRGGDDELARHIIQYADIYSVGLNTREDHISPALSNMLCESFESGVRSVLEHEAHQLADPTLIARFIGHGVVGLIEAWLLSDSTRNPDMLAEALFRSIPEWITHAPHPKPAT